MDRISQLPEPILQRILCHLPPKQAFKSCALSKSWRHICSTLPKFELHESFFEGNQEALFSFLDVNLCRYRDQNISLPEILLEIPSNVGSEFVPLLETWIPVVSLGMGLKKFTLNFTRNYLCMCHRLRLFHFDLLAVVFKAESLEELHLTGCDFSHVNHSDKLLSNSLRKLSLTKVRISEVTLERIIRSCPLIEHVTINLCHGLGNIKVDKAPKLKHFDLTFIDEQGRHNIIEIDVPSIECIRISNPRHWIHSATYLSFAHLKSLYLSNVRLSENSFHIFSQHFCCLEELSLQQCHGFEEFKLVSRSIKNLSLYLSELRKAAIDVPNIQCFKLSAVDSLPSISFTTTSSDWKSEISVLPTVYQMFTALYDLHKASFSRSEFSLRIAILWGFFPPYYVGLYPPVVVENLTIISGNYLSDTGENLVERFILFLEGWLGHVFCFFHPRNIQHSWHANPKDASERVDNQIVEFLRSILSEDNQLGLEQVESSIEQGNEADNREQRIRFRLKWSSKIRCLPSHCIPPIGFFRGL